MLKLIASDMDGTLLNDQKEIFPYMAAVVQALNEKGSGSWWPAAASWKALPVILIPFRSP